MNNPLNHGAPEVIAILPAAGFAKRLPVLNGSKEMVTIGSMVDPVSHKLIPKPVCINLLEKYRMAGITNCIIIMRKDKKDIPAYLGTGELMGMSFSYLYIEDSCGTACTIDHAHEYMEYATVALGFPDILFNENDSFVRLLNKIESTKADVVLGLFPADKPEKVDMVKVGANQEVSNISIKPKMTDLQLTWGLAIWRPTFSEFLHDYISTYKSAERGTELHIGQVIHEAINHGMTVIGEKVSNYPYLDIGTPDDLALAIKQYESFMKL